MKTICIMCPIGCPLEINRHDDVITVKGNSCKRGEIYGKNELENPKRIVTSLVRLTTGGVVSVKTDSLIDKKLIPSVLEEIKKITLTPPLNIGDIVIKNVADSDVNIIVTSNIF